MNIIVDALPVRRRSNTRAWESRLMNRHLRVWVAVLGMSLPSSMVLAQVVPTTNPEKVTLITGATRGSDAITPEQRAEIDGSVNEFFNIVMTGAPADQAEAKKRFLTQTGSKAAPGYTPQYFDALASSVDQKIVGLLKTKLTMRQRINLGVLAAEVARSTESHQLSNAAELLLKDDKEVVALWGAKTAKYVVPAYVKLLAGKKNTLLPLMVDTGKKYPGPVLWEIYEGLTLGPVGVRDPRLAAQARPQIVVVIPFVQDLLKARAAMYGATAPKEALADATGTTFLTYQEVWKGQSAAQQKGTLLLLRDLLTKPAAIYTPGNADLLGMIQRSASGLGVVVATVKTESDAIQKFNQSTPAAQVAAAVASLVTALDASPLMATPAGAPAVQNGPASRPASGGSSPASNLAVIK
jgi:hypothetical protein